MVHVESLDSFVEQAEALYKASPLKARYSLKYSHAKGRLSLKVTDDQTTVQYKTDQQSDLRKIDKLTTRFIHMMATGDDPPEEVSEEVLPPQQPQRQRRQQQQDQGGRSKKTRRKG